MSQPLKIGKFYLHQAGQAIGVIGKFETASWGKCYVVELSTPAKMGSLMPMKPDMTDDDWHEITRDEFIRMQRRSVMEAAKAAGVVKPLSLWARAGRWAKNWRAIRRRNGMKLTPSQVGKSPVPSDEQSKISDENRTNGPKLEILK